MIQLLNIFVDICLLRKGPQHLPRYAVLTGMCLVVYVATSLVYLAIVES